MAQQVGHEQKSPEEKQLEIKKREEREEKERKEKQEYEEHLQRLRNLIKEDQKTNMEKAKVEIDGIRAMQTVSLREAQIKPLTTCGERQIESSNGEEIRIKIIHETKKQLHTLKADATVDMFRKILIENFGIKNPKAFISTVGEIDFSVPSTTLKSIGVSDMDTIYVHKL
ncbi:hypothetical protein NEAUS03_1733 [Nematocida ausubeli]|nr:hypothetical protein NEAUS03_1733 [Nematocida ausubeli]